MAERQREDLEVDMSDDGGRLVISFTPFSPLKDDSSSNVQCSDKGTDDVTATVAQQHTTLTVEVYEGFSDVDVKHELYQKIEPVKVDKIKSDAIDKDVSAKNKTESSLLKTHTTQFHKSSPSFFVQDILQSCPAEKESSKPLPSVDSIIRRSDDHPVNCEPQEFYHGYQAPLSFCTTADYNYTLDTEYSPDNSQSQHGSMTTTSSFSPVPSWTTPNIPRLYDVKLQFSDQAPITAPLTTEWRQHESDTQLQQQNDGLPIFKKPNQAKIFKEKKVYQRYPKPPYSYAAMSILAIENSPNKALQYREIAETIRQMFPDFFNGEYQGWRRSVRHMLSRMDCFYYEKNFHPITTRSCFFWKVDLTKVNPEWFMRQSTKEDLRKLNHEYKPYLHQQLNVPPVILPERQCVNDTASSASNVSRAIRDVLLQNHQSDTMQGNDSQAFQLPKTGDAFSDLGVTLPSRPSNYKLDSLSTFAADPDDFLGAKTHITKHSASTTENSPEIAVDEETSPPTPQIEDSEKDLKLPTYILDSPIASPIPHDIYRDTEGPDRHCPSAELSSSAPRASSTSSDARVRAQTKKRPQPITVAKSTKKAKTETSNQPSTFSNPFFLQSLHHQIPTDSAAMFYAPSDPYQQYSSSYLPPFTTENDKPLCWPPVDNVLLGGAASSLVGYSPEHFSWIHQMGYPYQYPASYGYPMYDAFQQVQNEASRWHQNPYDGALNLSTKTDW